MTARDEAIALRLKFEKTGVTINDGISEIAGLTQLLLASKELIADSDDRGQASLEKVLAAQASLTAALGLLEDAIKSLGLENNPWTKGPSSFAANMN